MDYTECLDFLYNQLPFFQRDGSAKLRKWNLDKTLALADFFGNPHQRLKCIHVGGTNGKGSISHLIAAAMQQAGYKTGLYTSPHYVDFRERIKINQTLMNPSFLTEFVEKAMPFIKDQKPSFFELTFVMALCYFEQEDVDVAVIEVGLGGRLDSTNIITPLLSVISNIGYDHQEILGDTLDKIATEKAGIIKAQVPVVIGERHPETDAVFETKAREQNAPLCFAEDTIHISDFETTLEHAHLNFQVNGAAPAPLVVEVTGAYQAKNIGTALCAIHQLIEKKYFPELNMQAVYQGWPQLKSLTRFIGRWQVLERQPLTVGDSAHNINGFTSILPQLATFSHCHFVVGFSKEKDLEAMLRILPKEATYYCCAAQLPRALPATSLYETFVEKGFTAHLAEKVEGALEMAKKNWKPGQIIFVGGSIFVLGEAMTYYKTLEYGYDL